MSNKYKNNNEIYSLNISEGIRFASNKDFDKSNTFFIKALKIDDSKHEAYINLSNLLIIKKDKK